MVFVPDLALRSDFLGLGSGLPRAVPSDAVVAVLDERGPRGPAPEARAGRARSGSPGLGARRLVAGRQPVRASWPRPRCLRVEPVRRRAARHRALAAAAHVRRAAVAVRRGAPGQDGGADPPATCAVARARQPERRGRGGRSRLRARVRGRSGSGAVRHTAVVLLGAVVVNAPWIVAGALHGSGALSDPTWRRGLRGTGEGVLPLPLTLLGLGGIWNAEVVPASREGWAAVVALVLTVVRRRRGCTPVVGRGWRARPLGLVVAAVVGLVVALAGSRGPRRWRGWCRTVPGGGLLRDGSGSWRCWHRSRRVCSGSASPLWRTGAHPGGADRGGVTALVLRPARTDAGPRPRARRTGSGQSPTRRSTAAARATLEERPTGGGQGGDVLILPFSSYRLPELERRPADPRPAGSLPDTELPRQRRARTSPAPDRR